ncbi:MAG: hypothetical protein KAS32_13365 [Candidatus Peribacteraceae bacterium]|nr:hypothetical protein [Candidatus Peribacteraceae bacterium]
MAAPLIFATVALMHDLYLSSLDGLFYYGSAAVFDFVVIILLSKLKPIMLVCDIQLISLISMILNAIGWAMWMFYLSPALYNGAFIGLYLCACFVIGRGTHAGIYSVADRRALFYSDSGTCVYPGF